MSMERLCAICGEGEGIRLNFVSREAEEKFHSEKYYCDFCKDIKS